MKINVTQKLLGFDGNEILVVFQACPMCGRPKEEEDARTLRSVCVDALTGMYQDERSLDGTKKFERAVLATRIHSNDEPDLSAEDIVLVKELIGKRFGPIIVLRAWTILDPPGG